MYQDIRDQLVDLGEPDKPDLKKIELILRDIMS